MPFEVLKGPSREDLAQRRGSSADLKAIAELYDRDLIWTQPSRWRAEYELRAGDEVAGRLHWRRAPHSPARAEAADGRWDFRRGRIQASRVTIYTGESDSVIGRVEPKWNGMSALELDGGRRFLWTPANFRRTQWAWKSADGDVLLRLRERRVCLEERALPLPELSLLTLLAWYLAVLREADAGGD